MRKNLILLCMMLSLIVMTGTVFAIPFASEISPNLASVDFTSQTLTISYYLNQSADTVQIQILDGGGSPVATFDGSTIIGPNSVVWNGKSDNTPGGTPIAPGSYSIRIRVANATGFGAWTEVSSNKSVGSAAVAKYATITTGWPARGITVDNNTSSQYFGRVYVSISGANANFQKGFLRYHSDMSTYTNEGDYIVASPGTGGAAGSVWEPTPTGNAIPWGSSVADDGELWASGQPTAQGFFIGRGMPSDLTPTAVDTSIALAPRGSQISGSGANKIIWWADSETNGLFKNATVGNNVGASVNLYGLAINTVISFGNAMYPRHIRLDDAGNLYALTREGTSTATTYVYRWDAATAQNATNYPLTRANASWNIRALNATGTRGNGLIVAKGDPGNFSDDSVFLLTMGISSVKGVYFVGNAGTGTISGDLTVASNRVFDVPEASTTSATAQDLGVDYGGNLITMNGSVEVLRAWSPPGASDITTPAHGSQGFAISNNVPVDISEFLVE